MHPPTRRAPPSSHRALHRLRFPARRWLVVLLLPLAIDALYVSLLDPISGAWRGMLAVWFDWMDWDGSVGIEPVSIGARLTLALPRVTLETRPISNAIWLGIGGATSLVLATSFLLPERLLPLRYLLRFTVLIQAGALALFALSPASFPHTAAAHTRDGLLMTLAFIALVPWLHALTYYIFDFHLLKKIGLTLLTMAYLLLFAPFQYLAHLWLMHHLSVAAMPVLYLLLGMPLQILIFVAFYGWAMSWKPTSTAPRAEPSRLPSVLRQRRWSNQAKK